MADQKTTRQHTYFVRGMHCSSCEILIEKKLLGLKNIKSVEAKAGRGEVEVVYEGQRPQRAFINRLFKKENYFFSDIPQELQSGLTKKDYWAIGGVTGIVILGFIALNKFGLTSQLSVNSKSSLPMFFTFGLLAGVSSCAALVGGMVLSLSKQWEQIYGGNETTMRRFYPHLVFNIGRIFSFLLLGGVLGGIGSKLGISLTIGPFLVLAVSVMMILLSMQMLGFSYFQKFQFTAPKFITRYVADEKNFKGRWMPFVMGFLTFFLPCGFTITVQSLALLSGGTLQGSLIMFAFVLGTTPTLLAIGFSSLKLSESPHWSNRFTKIAGVLVLFFAIFNINSQMNILGLPSLSNFTLKSGRSAAVGSEGLPSLTEGKQIIKMDAFAGGYSPNYFKVKTGIPVRWEITDKGTSGCTNAVISRGLFEGEIALSPGKVSVKEFTPEKPGKYKFSCWMGMISGLIEVIDSSGQSGASDYSSEPVSSGASSCSCGCGGGN